MLIIEEIVEKLSFLNGVDLDAWTLSIVLSKNGTRRYSYEIASIIVSYSMISYYEKLSIKDSFINEQIQKYRKELYECFENLKPLGIEKILDILKEYAEEYRKRK